MRRALVFLVALSACGRSERELKPEPAPSAPVASASAVASPPPSPLVLAQGVRILRAASGDTARLVKETREREKADGRDLVVYVGAKWCEPCQRFHKAAAAGALDTDFPKLSVLEFDLDEDRDRLVAAGYESQLIPLFVVPNADGTASSKRIEGSVKGEGAVANIAPRLRGILGK